jgi:hypothetical protein
LSPVSALGKGREAGDAARAAGDLNLRGAMLRQAKSILRGLRIDQADESVGPIANLRRFSLDPVDPGAQADTPVGIALAVGMLEQALRERGFFDQSAENRGQ